MACMGEQHQEHHHHHHHHVKLLPGANAAAVFTCTIGKKLSHAKHYVSGAQEVETLLAEISRYCTSPSPRNSTGMSSSSSSYHKKQAGKRHHPHHHPRHHQRNHHDFKSRLQRRGFTSNVALFPGVKSPTFRGRIVRSSGNKSGSSDRRPFFNRHSLSADNGFWYF
mmetsp:Transcript_7711/g.12260  ORF Transcript_7711/g.12260 Transcript_7711/m.12260 type:complete len:166 (+) Transcript_7711:305-802(+)